MIFSLDGHSPDRFLKRRNAIALLAYSPQTETDELIRQCVLKFLGIDMCMSRCAVMAQVHGVILNKVFLSTLA